MVDAGEYLPCAALSKNGLSSSFIRELNSFCVIPLAILFTENDEINHELVINNLTDYYLYDGIITFLPPDFDYEKYKASQLLDIFHMTNPKNSVNKITPSRIKNTLSIFE